MKWRLDYSRIKSFAFSSLSVLILFIILGGLAQKTLAQDNSVTVTTNRVGNSLKIVAYNDNPHSVTLTVNISGSNFKPRERLPVQVVLSAKSKKTVLNVDKRNKSKSLQISVSSKWVVGNVNASHDDSYIYRLPYQNNHSFKVGQSHNGSFSHTGNWRYSIDFMMPIGTPVLAAREGIVARIEEGYTEGGPSKEYEDKANYIYIEHPDGTFGEYAHLQKNGVLVDPGRRVQKGQVIGLSGNTGFSSGPHLHFSVSRVISEGSYRSIPVKIKTAKGVFVRLQEGVKYSPR